MSTAPVSRTRRVQRDRRFRPTIDDIIDGLVVDNELIPEDVGAYLAPRSRVATVMEVLPECDTCGRQARFDGRSWFTGTWAWWCRRCFVELAGGTVGGLGGVYLLRPDEVPDEAREVCDALAAERHLRAAS